IRSSANLLDGLRSADDGDDAGGDAEEEPDEESEVSGADPAIDEQPAAGAEDDRNDERESDAAQRAPGAHRLGGRILAGGFRSLFGTHFFLSGGLGGASPGPHAGSTWNPGSFGGGATGFGGGAGVSQSAAFGE